MKHSLVVGVVTIVTVFANRLDVGFLHLSYLNSLFIDDSLIIVIFLS